jgi:carboxymethylproline synthase
VTNKDNESRPAVATSLQTSRRDGDVVVVEFTAGHRHNPFSMGRMAELTELLKQLDAEPDIGCIVLYGGLGRSFAAGGDLSEPSTFTGGSEIDGWIDKITDLYVAVAGIECPVVAAIDGYAIGLGLQVALCCDYRVGSTRAKLVMPEFRLGIACNFGAFLLERVVGRAVMQAMLFTCEDWSSDRAFKDGLLHRVAPTDDLLDEAVGDARRISSYTRAAVRGTRPRMNKPLIKGLEEVRRQGKVSHRRAFAAGEAQVRMRRILASDKAGN